MQKEDWIKEVFESTKGMQKAEPSPFLFEQISARIQKGREVVQANLVLKWGMTAFVLVILSLNVVSIVKTNSAESTIEQTTGTSDNYFNNTITYNY